MFTEIDDIQKSFFKWSNERTTGNGQPVTSNGAQIPFNSIVQNDTKIIINEAKSYKNDFHLNDWTVLVECIFHYVNQP